MIKLGKRLDMVADMVRDSVRLADIGTDHAYLPAYLIQKGKIKSAIACDLRENPLENARQTLVKYKTQDKIDLKISNGLDELEPFSVDDIVIAGMGGMLIVDILSRCNWIKNKNINLILQPMAHVEQVRKYLIDNGFEIIRENATIDSHKNYVAINTKFTGNKFSNITKSFYYIGKLDECNSPYATSFLTMQRDRLKRRADSLYKKDINNNESKELYAIIRDIERCL